MSRYLLLVLLNLPFALIGILNAIVGHRLGRIPRSRMSLRVTFWLLVVAGLALAEPVYSFLFSNNLTRTEPLSLFDVIEITAIIGLFLLYSRLRAKHDALDRKLQDLHRELVIRLAEPQERENTAAARNILNATK